MPSTIISYLAELDFSRIIIFMYEIVDAKMAISIKKSFVDQLKAISKAAYIIILLRILNNKENNFLNWNFQICAFLRMSVQNFYISYSFKNNNIHT